MTLFEKKSPSIMKRLMNDLSLDSIQAAAILGNIGHECAGFTQLREIGITGMSGGWGWCQWTGVRRDEFFRFCGTWRNFEDDEKNYAFLILELRTTEKKSVEMLRKRSDLPVAVAVFQKWFERAKVENLSSRIRYAEIALKAFRASMAEAAATK